MADKKIRYHLIGHAGSNDDPCIIRRLAWEEGAVVCFTHTWVWPLYCQLKAKGVPATFGYVPEPGAINIIHGQVARHQLRPADLRNHFFVVVRADFPPFPYGAFEVVQNKRTTGGRSVFMPHFPQPGLLPRDKDRDEVCNVCASGERQNFANLDALEGEMDAMGCRFVFKSVGEWQDMTDVDILLGIRSFDKQAYDSKPPTKLFNAWLAGIPFIGGYDSAYEQVGLPGKDYLRVATERELLETVRALKQEPCLYSSLVAEGKKSVAQYTPERIAERWLGFLEGKASEAYARWARGEGRLADMFKAAAFEVVEKQLRGFKRSDVWV